MSVRGLNISLKIKVVTWQSSLWIQLPRRSWKSNTSPSSSPLWIAEKSCIFVFQDSNILCHKIGIFLISNDLTTLQSNQSIKTTVYNSSSAYAQLCGILLRLPFALSVYCWSSHVSSSHWSNVLKVTRQKHNKKLVIAWWGAFKLNLSKKLVFCPNWGGGGGLPIPNFYTIFPGQT